jgi:NAD(P)-dependent dehydrogenase (short-subunit alcohol dehydrogenase family)
MTTEIIRYQIGEENAQAFEMAYQKAESILRASKHCLGYRMLRGQEEAQKWIPTVTLTGMSAGFEKNRKMMAALRERVPLGRPALPADIAAAITFLAGADAGFITGVNLPVDGGVSASNGEPKFH